MSDDSGDRTEAELERTRQAVRDQVAAQSAANQSAVDADGAASTETADNGEGWDSYTKAELEDELRTRGLPTSGNKDELVGRLNDDDAGR